MKTQSYSPHTEECLCTYSCGCSQGAAQHRYWPPAWVRVHVMPLNMVAKKVQLKLELNAFYSCTLG